MHVKFASNVGKRWEKPGIAKQLAAHQGRDATASLVALHQHVALCNTHFQRMAVGLRQRLVEHGTREVHPVVRAPECDVVHRHKLEQRAQQFRVNRQFGRYLIRILRG
ncbi:Uncharacterised protein [Mycobacterium tuberculosis]|uniref:Uncharacterized protein n=1 Tax=Mycobacterium tuberculosis TaxID=1773 RepID=A0A655CZN7_MYCTX|nr:Uncharacterised protein [Mycobacterium tuberculosis]CKN92229.1 Uncharacterised protein [Mycobacterium tuberculosis]CNU38021.1 Uncharacterised protein [Mycobacterium tuberculosis]CNU46217.1 Uncharacterised protein [Mycobacterium tuberculosis]